MSKDNRKVIYINGYGPQVTCNILFFSNISSLERVQRESKNDSWEKRVDLESKSHNSRE